MGIAAVDDPFSPVSGIPAAWTETCTRAQPRSGKPPGAQVLLIVSHSLSCLLEKMSGLPASASNVGTGPVWGQVLLRQEANWLASGIGGFPLSG